MDYMDVFSRIAADAQKGELVFPTHAEVTLRVQRALDDPDCHVETAARLVQADPLLSARVVAVANSAAFNRSGKAIADVRMAVIRLGFRTVRSLATALLMRQMAGSSAELPRERELASRLWEHTSHVAALAHVIARRVTRLDAETAFFAGIVHEVGGFYLLSRAQGFPGLLDGGMADWEAEGQAVVGRAVLAKLGVPEAVMAGIEAYWQGYLAMPPATLGDTLLLADELASVGSPLRHSANESRDEGAEAKIDMAIGEETLHAILDEAAGEMASLTQALRF